MIPLAPTDGHLVAEFLFFFFRCYYSDATKLTEGTFQRSKEAREIDYCGLAAMSGNGLEEKQNDVNTTEKSPLIKAAATRTAPHL